MIEIICDGNGEIGNEKGTTEKSLPKNIKQIGDVGSGKRIYIEDYAFTYINSIAYQSPQMQTAGVLLGDVASMEGKRCIFIKGVIKAKNQEDNAEIVFNEAVWSSIYSETEKYFPGLSIVGWFAALPRITPELICRMKKLHYDNFAGNDKTMYLIDIEERDENFYLYEDGDIRKQRGYVCFYERNLGMQEYMLEKNKMKFVEKPENEKVISSVRTLLREKEEEKQRRRSAIMSYAACAFMATVVAVTGVNLVRSYEKMQRIDSSISDIVANLNSKGTSAASGDEVIPVNVVYETKATEESGSGTSGSGAASSSGAGSAGSETSGSGTANSSGTSSSGTASSNGAGNGTESGTGSAGDEQESANTAGSAGGSQNSGDSAAVSGGASAEISYKKYVVQKGDTLLGIAQKYYGTTQKAAQIIEINNLTDADRLYIGQEIKLP